MEQSRASRCPGLRKRRSRANKDARQCFQANIFRHPGKQNIEFSKKWQKMENLFKLNQKNGKKNIHIFQNTMAKKIQRLLIFIVIVLFFVN
jgi:hypothetical protein